MMRRILISLIYKSYKKVGEKYENLKNMKTYKEKVKQVFLNSEIIFTQDEMESIEYADFGLKNREEEGLNLIVYVNNERYCAKEMVLLPSQTCPEHKHPHINGTLGKKETFRCRKGKVYLYLETEEPLNEELIHARIALKNKEYYTAGKEIILMPGKQYTIEANTFHWFQGREEGVVVSEFSSSSDDLSDVFRNPNIIRVS